MKLEDFNSGDVVTLKSGSARMTVRYAVDYTAAANTGRPIGVHCDWQDANGAPHSDVFTPDQLHQDIGNNVTPPNIRNT